MKANCIRSCTLLPLKVMKGCIDIAAADDLCSGSQETHSQEL